MGLLQARPDLGSWGGRGTPLTVGRRLTLSKLGSSFLPQYGSSALTVYVRVRHRRGFLKWRRRLAVDSQNARIIHKLCLRGSGS